jgi:hypothetical protein
MAVRTRAQQGITVRLPRRYDESDYPTPSKVVKSTPKRKTKVTSQSNSNTRSRSTPPSSSNSKAKASTKSRGESGNVSPPRPRRRLSPYVLIPPSRNPQTRSPPVQKEASSVPRSTPPQKEVIPVLYTQSQRMREIIFPSPAPRPTPRPAPTSAHRREDSNRAALKAGASNVVNGNVLPENLSAVDVDSHTLPNGRKVVVLGPITTRKVHLSGGRSLTHIRTSHGWKVLKRE